MGSRNLTLIRIIEVLKISLIHIGSVVKYKIMNLDIKSRIIYDKPETKPEKIEIKIEKTKTNDLNF